MSFLIVLTSLGIFKFPNHNWFACSNSSLPLNLSLQVLCSYSISFFLFTWPSPTLTVGLSPSKKKLFYVLQWKYFKNDEKCFIIHLKSPFCSQFIQFLVLTFWSCIKNCLIKKIRLISKFILPQPGQQTITIYILSNISWSKGNQAMKFGQVIESNKRYIFL